MKILKSLILFSLIAVLHARSQCGCPDDCRRKIQVKNDCAPEIKIIYTGEPCECQKALPYRVEKPIIPIEKCLKHKYNIEVKEEKPVPVCRYIYNTKVERPIVEKVECSQYPVKIERLLEKPTCETRFIYNAKIEKPVKECETEFEGLTANIDRIVLPREDCPQPCCHKPKCNCVKKVKSCEEKESSEEIKCRKCQYNSEEDASSSEEIVLDSLEDICTRKRCKTGARKTKPCLCESQSSEERVCSKNDSCEPECSSEEAKTCNSIEVQTSEECFEYKVPLEPVREKSHVEVQTSDEYYPRRKLSKCFCNKKTSVESCEEIKVESSEETKVKSCEGIKVNSCEETKVDSCEESSEETKEKSSEETRKKICCHCNLEDCICEKTCSKSHVSGNCKKSCSEFSVESKEQSEEKCNCKKCFSTQSKKFCDHSAEDLGDVVEEEHCYYGKPRNVYRKPSCSCRFAPHDKSNSNLPSSVRRKREFFLDDMQDCSVRSEPLTRKEIQQIISKLQEKYATNSTVPKITKRRRKGKRRSKSRSLLQNEDKFEENNKLKTFYESRGIDDTIISAPHVEEMSKKEVLPKNIQEVEEALVNGKHQSKKETDFHKDPTLDNKPEALIKLEEQTLLQNEDRNKRHSKTHHHTSDCRTIRKLIKKPKYNNEMLADAGLSQYIPEIISNQPKKRKYSNEDYQVNPKYEEHNGPCFYDYNLRNRNKRHLSTYNGDKNYPIKFVDASETRHEHRRHRSNSKHTKKDLDLQNAVKFEVDPKCYYKYLSLTAPDLSTPQLDTFQKPQLVLDSKIEDNTNIEGLSRPEESCGRGCNAPDCACPEKNPSHNCKRIVYDHLGHKFLEYNGFRTLIKPKINYVEDFYNTERPKVWTCKEDLIDPKDFGKVTTQFEDIQEVTESSNLGTTTSPNTKTEKINLAVTDKNENILIDPKNVDIKEDISKNEKPEGPKKLPLPR